MRIILYTGKGGVGKTSIAAATALRCAERGYRTLVISTDAAHSLADSLDVPLGPEPTAVSPGLWAQEVDAYHEISEHWGTIQGYLLGILAWRGLDEVVAEEMAIFPGMEELSSLLLITRYAHSKQFDVVIIDCAPTGETLRLLSFPEVARWWLKNIFPVQRKAYHLIRPMVRPFTDMPLPADDVFESIERVFSQLDEMHTILSNPSQSTVRLVVNPEKMVVKESQRTFTYLNLYGYTVDAVMCNRVFPDAIQDQYFNAWKGIQERNWHLIEECFAPLPIFRAPLFGEEIVGQHMLRELASAVFGDRDPAEAMYPGRAQTVAKENGRFVLRLPLPLVSKDSVDLRRVADELVIQIGNQRRNVALPRVLIGLDVAEAKLSDNELKVVFHDGG